MSGTPAPDSFVPGHNHKHCIHRAVASAQSVCDREGLRFTGLRKRVLELVWANHEPVTAYDLLKELRREKGNAEPPTVYRALDFLQQINLVHRIESLNAYIGCDHPGSEHVSRFMICKRCNRVAELVDGDRIHRAIAEEAGKAGFRAVSETVEIHGICRSCQ
jgi:Fur family zinc uptake transcriptional regulator